MGSTNTTLRTLLIVSVAAAALLSKAARADSITVNWNNDSSTLLRTAANVALTQGSATTNNDGALIQLGYFSTGTTTNNFSGTWIPLTGATNVNPTTIGDSADLTGAGNGVFQFNTTFNTGTTNVQVYVSGFDDGAYQTQSSVSISSTVPPDGQVLAIRFFDPNTSQYNTVSTDLSTWKWKSPDNVSSININLATDLASLEWESVEMFGLTGTEFKTVLPIPEPSTYALLCVGAFGMMALRRRIKR